MAEATKQGFCENCAAEVPCAPNPHRVRNAVATSFAAANMALVRCDETSFGPTERYVCPHCGRGLTPLSHSRQ
jgi:hypothetical protein